MPNLSCYDSMISYARKNCHPYLIKRHGVNDCNIARTQQNRHKKNHYHKLDKRQTFKACTVHKPWDNQGAGYIL